jgi:DNA-binding Xre family transcriptional regulator
MSTKNMEPSGKLKNRLLYLHTEKERRERRHISYTEISKATGISTSVLSRWVNEDIERFDSPVVVKLCDYFGCELTDLLYIDRSDDEETGSEAK